MGTKTQVKKEEDTGTGCIWTGYRYGNSNTTKKPIFESNITKFEDVVFAQGFRLKLQNMRNPSKPLSTTSNENTPRVYTLDNQSEK